MTKPDADPRTAEELLAEMRGMFKQALTERDELRSRVERLVALIGPCRAHVCLDGYEGKQHIPVITCEPNDCGSARPCPKHDTEAR